MRPKPRVSVSPFVVAACVAGVTWVAAHADVRDDGHTAELASLSCRQIVAPTGDRSPTSLRWYEQDSARTRPTLDRWCRAVGPVVYQSQPAHGHHDVAPVNPKGPTAIVSWNVNVGAGDLSAFVADLQAGQGSDGQRVEHFVLLLQEALRTGDAVFGAAGARGRQARAIAAVLQRLGSVIVGGDFNTWLGPSEPALREMTRVSGQAAHARQPTYSSGVVLDYLFFRTPASWRATYERAGDTYGSDHYPLVGWITPAPATATEVQR